MLKPGVFKHINCRNNIYPKSTVRRQTVPDDRVFWSLSFEDYNPPDFTAAFIKGQVWADGELSKEFAACWNKLDGAVNRVSFNGIYEVKDNCPLNPMGRTGLRGRGILGRWGPNHAADPVVTRWKRNENNSIQTNASSSRQILQMIAIQRSDNKMWAIPGGMVDPGEKVSTTLKREFMEEALNNEGNQQIDDFFKNGVEIYKGYVDDFRNTDNAWMETVAYNFHDEEGKQLQHLNLEAGDDATNVKWLDLHSNIELHANHVDIVLEVVKRLNAHW